MWILCKSFLWENADCIKNTLRQKFFTFLKSKKKLFLLLIWSSLYLRKSISFPLSVKWNTIGYCHWHLPFNWLSFQLQSWLRILLIIAPNSFATRSSVHVIWQKFILYGKQFNSTWTELTATEKGTISCLQGNTCKLVISKQRKVLQMSVYVFLSE